MFAQLLRYLAGEIIPRVKHGAQQTLYLELGIEVFPDHSNGLHQVRQPFKRVIFTLHGNHHSLRGGECVDCQQAQSRRAVNQQKIVIITNSFDGIAQSGVALLHVHQLDFGTGEIAVGRDEVIATFHH